MTKKGNISADEATYRTSLEGVFAVGDATNKGASIAIEAIGEANRASQVIDAYLNGREISYRRPFVSEREVTENLKAQLAGKPHAARIKMPQRSPEERRHDFQEINLGFAEADARAEAAAVWSAAATTMPTVSSSAAPTSMRFTLSVWKVSSIRALWRKNWFALSVTRESVSSATSVCGPVMKWRQGHFGPGGPRIPDGHPSGVQRSGHHCRLCQLPQVCGDLPHGCTANCQVKNGFLWRTACAVRHFFRLKSI